MCVYFIVVVVVFLRIATGNCRTKTMQPQLRLNIEGHRSGRINIYIYI